MELLVEGVSSVGMTIFIIAIAFILGCWLDKNVFNKDRYK